MKKLIALLATLFPLLVLAPLEAQANLECSDGTCTQTFYFTGSAQEFVVPDGLNAIDFEVRAASGSRGGGGGVVRGTLHNPPSSLFVLVGQAGSYGSDRPGGFNGGGASGGSLGNEGSGGGASDIRFGVELGSRAVVAGGGGGGGGGGIPGGDGGQPIAASGSSGQGAGGGGGTHDAGGAPGINTWGYVYPTEGSFGSGGTGGFGPAAGGGGGGGGWYGGGGGGGSYGIATGGGGGGGSSYALPDATWNVTYQQGAHFGHGRVLISYQLPPEVISVSANQLSRNQIKFQISMNQNVQGFSAEDVTYSDATCSIWRTAVIGMVAEVTLDSCAGPEVTLTLRERSVGSSAAGPLQAISHTAAIDRVGPNFSWQQIPERISTNSLIVEFALSDALLASSNSFEVSGCELEVQDRFAIVTNCPEGISSINLPPNSFTDAWGNPGPLEAKTLTFTVDTTAPSASWSPVVVSGTGPFSYSSTLTFSEEVSMSTTAVTFNSTVECEQGNDGLTFWASCDYASLEWSVDLDQVTDQVGNSSSGIVSLSFEHQRPPPEPLQAQSPAAEPTPQAPTAEPQPSPEPGPSVVIEPVAQESASTESQLITEPSTESVETEPATGSEEIEMVPEENQYGLTVVELPPKPTRSAESSPEVLTVANQEPEEKTLIESRQELDAREVLEINQAQPVAGPELDLAEPAQLPWLALGAIGVVVLLGLGAWRFSGR